MESYSDLLDRWAGLSLCLWICSYNLFPAGLSWAVLWSNSQARNPKTKTNNISNIREECSARIWAVASLRAHCCSRTLSSWPQRTFSQSSRPQSGRVAYLRISLRQISWPSEDTVVEQLILATVEQLPSEATVVEKLSSDTSTSISWVQRPLLAFKDLYYRLAFLKKPLAQKGYFCGVSGLRNVLLWKSWPQMPLEMKSWAQISLRSSRWA